MPGYNLEGKIAIITGASRGIGRAIALKLAEEGVKLVINYDSKSDDEYSNPINELIEDIKKSGGDAIGYGMDVADLDQHQEILDFALTQYGQIDILVNNAGIVPFAEFHEITPEIFDRTHNVNARGPYFLTQKITEYMIKNRIQGNVIFISSVTSSLFGGSTLSHYAATKAALLAYTRSLASPLAKHGIRINAVLPGTHETDVNRADLNQPSEIEGLTKGNVMDSKIPLGLGKPEDVAGLVTFLVSDDASYITGQHYVVDGGWTTSLQ